MTPTDALELTREAIRVTLAVSAPVVLAVMLIGVVISLLQALTQVQEMTLTFVPKIIVALGVLIISAPFIGQAITTFAEETYGRIEYVDRTAPADRRR